MSWIYLTDGTSRVRTTAENVAAELQGAGFWRCDHREWAVVGRRLRRQRENRKSVRDAARPKDAEAQP